jgi:site-specific DNA-methyltransferase (adenine-specific)
MKPGAYGAVFAGTRTQDLMSISLRLAGFEIRDTIMWVYGSGFPKSHNVALGIDKLKGHPNRGEAIPTASRYQASDTEEKNKLTSNPVEAYEAKSTESMDWQGWGTALKPAYEPIILIRKPPKGTVAQNVLAHGVGGINIDATRIKGKPWKWGTQTDIKGGGFGSNRPSDGNILRKNVEGGFNGRWPANIMLDEVSAEMLDAQSGGASRFFYTSKASKKEREAGLMHREAETRERKNTHPTVKPLDLMRYLVRLITPPNGVILDPFAGSGSTLCGAVQQGFDYIGIERDAEYVEIARARVEHWKREKESRLI